jgi:hypothetical protein
MANTRTSAAMLGLVVGASSAWLAVPALADTFTYSNLDRSASIEGYVVYFDGEGERKREIQECGWDDNDGTAVSGPYDISLIDGCEISTEGGESIALMNSMLGPDSIFAHGTLDCTSWETPDGDAYAMAQSNITVYFTVDGAIDLRLHGSIASECTFSGAGGGYIEMRENGAAIFYLESPLTGSELFDTPITCIPGATYAIDINADMEDGGGIGRSVVNFVTYSFTLESDAPPPCPWDTAPTGAPDGTVGLGDLNALLSNWGACPAPCPYDFAPAGGDEMVGLGDLNALLSNWGPCP